MALTLDVSWLNAGANALAAAQAAQAATPNIFTAGATFTGTTGLQGAAATQTANIDTVIARLQPILDGFRALKAG